LKVKPQPEIHQNGYLQLGVEVYGGALLNPWFDRDLSMAGRVTYLDSHQRIKSSLINFQRPIAVLPSLAIHLDSEANKSRSINPQTHLPVILCREEGTKSISFHSILQAQLESENKTCDVHKILDYEISFYDTQASSVVGLNDEFVASARLDNLLSCFIVLQALATSKSELTTFLSCSDHEEVGSLSAEGAAGTFFESVLERIYPDVAQRKRILSKSLLVSVDNAHGVHPNYIDKHDANHGPILNNGPVIKQNANQRYATNSETGSLFKKLCHLVGVPFQSFVVRSDMACGSTIGPITASGLGVKTVDVGVPQFAMHSIRELAGLQDSWLLYQVLAGFCNEKDIFVE